MKMIFKIIILIGFISIIHSDTYFSMNSQILPWQLQSNIDILTQKNSRLESTMYDLIEMKKSKFNCFTNSHHLNNKIFLISLDNKHNSIKRQRRTISGWTLTNPIYVEEPKWILIKTSNTEENNDGEKMINNRDPFYIARGKRDSIENFEANDYIKKFQLKNFYKNNNDIIKHNINMKNNLFNHSNSLMYYHFKRNDIPFTIQNGGIQLRDKHSDIMELLQEPFVISRGKKNIYKRNEYDKFSNAFDMISDKRFRNYRSEFFKQLMKEKDPFYVARGKR